MTGINSVPPTPKTIVSVNSRGGKSSGMVGKFIFVFVVFAVLVIGTLIAVNKWKAAKKAQVESSVKSKAEVKPAQVGIRRDFDKDPPPVPGQTSTADNAQNTQPAGAGTPPNAAGSASRQCVDGKDPIVLTDGNGKPVAGPNSAPLRVCSDGRVVVPALAGQGGAQPAQVNRDIGATGTRSAPPSPDGKAPKSRYAGDVIVEQGNSSTQSNAAGSPAALQTASTLAAVQQILGASQNQGGGGFLRTSTNAPAGSTGTGSGAGGGDYDRTAPRSTGGSSASQQGPIGNLLNGSQESPVRATMIGDRNMLLPESRIIPCNLSIRATNEVSGKATCVLSSDVYSDNGKVLLLEKGSEASGEYQAAMAQGQRRLFVLWTRIKSPYGVVVNINSPAADALGTTGLDGYIDNRWGERIGAAFMLSMVQDAIGYATAKASSSGSGVTLFQNTSQTGSSMAEQVLSSTINIKPTIYKNQGDPAYIYVARDVDFGSVYALRKQ